MSEMYLKISTVTINIYFLLKITVLTIARNGGLYSGGEIVAIIICQNQMILVDLSI